MQIARPGLPGLLLASSRARWKEENKRIRATFIRNYREISVFSIKHSKWIVDFFLFIFAIESNKVLCSFFFAYRLASNSTYYSWVKIHFENLHYKDFVVKFLLHCIHIHSTERPIWIFYFLARMHSLTTTTAKRWFHLLSKRSSLLFF